MKDRQQSLQDSTLCSNSSPQRELHLNRVYLLHRTCGTGLGAHQLVARSEDSGRVILHLDHQLG